MADECVSETPRNQQLTQTSVSVATALRKSEISWKHRGSNFVHFWFGVGVRSEGGKKKASAPTKLTGVHMKFHCALNHRSKELGRSVGSR